MDKQTLYNNLVSYLAGYFDGDGCICAGLHKGTQPAYVTIAIASYDKEVQDLFAGLFGGVVRTPPAHKKKTGKTLYSWNLGGINAQKCLVQLLPYLRVKRRQAELALLFEYKPKGPGHYKATTAERITRVQLAQQISALNNSNKPPMNPLSTELTRLEQLAELEKADIQQVI